MQVTSHLEGVGPSAQSFHLSPRIIKTHITLLKSCWIYFFKTKWDHSANKTHQRYVLEWQVFRTRGRHWSRRHFQQEPGNNTPGSPPSLWYNVLSHLKIKIFNMVDAWIMILGISPIEKGQNWPGGRSWVCPKCFCRVLFTGIFFGTLRTLASTVEPWLKTTLI